ncbi:MAG TPA: hypothetical protein VHX38_13925 [Pseudonocardiaceae bacterium]|jgi:hypothetical protein|nr:hypothetical protein [Pseudonocardiaceae bacterium]
MSQHRQLAMRVAGAREPTFLPLAVAAARAAEDTQSDEQARGNAERVRRQAEAADLAAAECWTALVAGCNSPARRVLTTRLRELTEATSGYVGLSCWFRAGSPHRQRVVGAEMTIAEAVNDGDGAEFAEAFAGYDQAVATALVSMLNRPSAAGPRHGAEESTGSSTP